jgi:hypothetical protein
MGLTKKETWATDEKKNKRRGVGWEMGSLFFCGFVLFL